MTTAKETIYTKDAGNKKLLVVREFDAPPEQVWKAWTESKLLDQWWAPKPWKANTKSMDFREGGMWLYYMQGPEGTRQYSRSDFKNIVVNKSFVTIHSFCDENGTVTNDLPGVQWKNVFTKSASGTRVEVEITFSSEADMQKLIEMGFKEGFAAAHANLDEILQKNNL